MKLSAGMLCPVCEAGTLRPGTKAVPFEYKGHHHIIDNIPVFECEICGESLWDDRDERDIEKTLTDIRRKIDGRLTSEEIREIRKFFGLTQIDFAKVLGVGEKNFARYENGQAIQSRSMDLVLRLLQAYPVQNMQIIHSGRSEWAIEKQQVNVSVSRTIERQQNPVKAVLNTQVCENDGDEQVYGCAF